MPPFELSFAKRGTYTYQCVIHPQILGTIDVVAPGGTTDTAADVDAWGGQKKGQWLTEGGAALQKLRSAAAASTKNRDGTTTWKVDMGASTPHTDIVAFAPMPASVRRETRSRSSTTRARPTRPASSTSSRPSRAPSTRRRARPSPALPRSGWTPR